MTPPPPRPKSPPLPVAELRPDDGRGLDGPLVFFCVEGAPRSACRTEVSSDGDVQFQTSMQGRLREVVDRVLYLEVDEGTVGVRHLLPSSIDLSPLIGHELVVTVRQRYHEAGRTTIDAEIRDASGALLLWARDGRLPTDREARGLAMRVSLSPSGERLAVSHDAGVSTLAPSGRAVVRLHGESFFAWVLRVGLDDLAWVLLRR